MTDLKRAMKQLFHGDVGLRTKAILSALIVLHWKEGAITSGRDGPRSGTQHRGGQEVNRGKDGGHSGGQNREAEGKEKKLKDTLRRSRNSVGMLGKAQAFGLRVLQVLREKGEEKLLFYKDWVL